MGPTTGIWATSSQRAAAAEAAWVVMPDFAADASATFETADASTFDAVRRALPASVAAVFTFSLATHATASFSAPSIHCIKKDETRLHAICAKLLVPESILCRALLIGATDDCHFCSMSRVSAS